MAQVDPFRKGISGAYQASESCQWVRIQQDRMWKNSHSLHLCQIFYRKLEAKLKG